MRATAVYLVAIEKRSLLKEYNYKQFWSNKDLLILIASKGERHDLK